MDIRTKLVIVLVGLSLGSMWLIGFFAYQTSASLLKEISERQLDALAESKARDVRKVISGWEDRVLLVASRTQLRLSLQQHNIEPADALVQRIQRIIDDARSATPSVVGIGVYGRDGQLVASTSEAESVPGAIERLPRAAEYVDEPSAWARPYVIFRGPLELDGDQIGAVALLLDRGALTTVANDYTGLGEFGQTIIAKHGESHPIVLHPLRHPIDDPAVLSLFANDLVKASLAGEEATFMEAHTDHRGEPVWGATRHIDGVGWGLTVQLSVDEELQRVESLRGSMIDLALSLSAFAILGGTLLGFYLSKPIRDLAQTVKRVRMGNTELRADVSSEDEVGELAQALNDFLDQGRPT